MMSNLMPPSLATANLFAVNAPQVFVGIYKYLHVLACWDAFLLEQGCGCRGNLVQHPVVEKDGVIVCGYPHLPSLVFFQPSDVWFQASVFLSDFIQPVAEAIVA